MLGGVVLTVGNKTVGVNQYMLGIQRNGCYIFVGLLTALSVVQGAKVVKLEPLPTDTVFNRTPEIKAAARACVAYYGERASRVFFLHNRKAGGTTVRKWLGEQQLCQKRFTAFVEESVVFNVSRLSEPGTVFITALREPVSRILSSYRFEGQGSFEEWVLKVCGFRW
jgi:hypothetical protein